MKVGAGCVWSPTASLTAVPTATWKIPAAGQRTRTMFCSCSLNSHASLSLHGLSVYCSLPVSFPPTAAIPNHYSLLTLALPDLSTCHIFLLVVYLRLLCRLILFLTAREALSCFVSNAPSPLSHF